MIINGQRIVTGNKFYSIKLNQPFWSAYQKYKWETEEPGFGISIDLFRKAYNEKKRIRVIYKGVVYEISPVTIYNFYGKSAVKPNFRARGGIRLIVIPQSKFKKYGTSNST